MAVALKQCRTDFFDVRRSRFGRDADLLAPTRMMQFVYHTVRLEIVDVSFAWATGNLNDSAFSSKATFKALPHLHRE